MAAIGATCGCFAADHWIRGEAIGCKGAKSVHHGGTEDTGKIWAKINGKGSRGCRAVLGRDDNFY